MKKPCDFHMFVWELHRFIVPLKQIEYGVYADLIVIYPKPYSIYLRGTIISNHNPDRTGASHKSVVIPLVVSLVSPCWPPQERSVTMLQHTYAKETL